MITVNAPDGAAETWLARPHGATGRLPGVLFLIDAIGLRPRTCAMADRIASWGYSVMAPNLFYRNGSAEELAPKRPLMDDAARQEFFADVFPRLGQFTPEVVRADLGAYLDALAEQADVTMPVAVVGYCFGARLALTAACEFPEQVAACAGFHGAQLATGDATSPHLGLGSARAEFVFGHADNDTLMPRTAVDRLSSALEAAGLKASNQIYPGALHGYSMADTSMYDEASCERHFTELEALLQRTLGQTTNPDR